MLSLLKTAVLMFWLIPEVAEHAASRALVYQIPIRFLMSPVALLLLDCSNSSKSTNFTYTPKSFTSSFFWNEGERIRYWSCRTYNVWTLRFLCNFRRSVRSFKSRRVTKLSITSLVDWLTPSPASNASCSIFKSLAVIVYVYLPQVTARIPTSGTLRLGYCNLLKSTQSYRC